MNMEPPPIPVKPTAKPPLITPSASPPPLRSNGYRVVSENVTVSQRPRKTATPRPTAQATPGPSSLRDDLVDIHQERRASTMRLLDFWDSLASYTRGLDEDDIVDVMTGEITRDNGILRNSKIYTFGSMDIPSTDDEDNSDKEDEDDEFGVDELDSFADPAGVEEEDSFRLGLHGKAMPPVTPLDPADANDLREFMEAESKRRELCGSEELGDIDEPERDPGHDGDVETEETQDYSEATLPVTTSDEELAGGYGSHSDNIAFLGSDDELDDWRAENSNIVYPVVKAGDEVRLEDCEILSGPSAELRKKEKGKSVVRDACIRSKEYEFPHQHQLCTPPSSSSTTPFVPMVNDIIDLTVDSTPSPQSKLPSHALKVPAKTARVSTNKNNRDPRDKSVEKVGNDGRLKDGISSYVPKGSAKMVNTGVVQGKKRPESSSITQTPKRQAYILLTPRSSSSPQKQRPTSQDIAKMKDKGKMKAVESSSDSQDGYVAMRQSSEIPSRMRHVRSTSSKHGTANQPRVPRPSQTKNSQGCTSDSEDGLLSASDPEKVQSRATPEHAITFPSPTLRKRKRMDSSSDMELAAPRSSVSRALQQRKPPSQHNSSSTPIVKPKAHKSKKRGSPQRRRRTPDSDSDSESNTSDVGEKYRSHTRDFPRPPVPYPYLSLQTPYIATHPPSTGLPPVQDPRAQLIITQAMQQLSALVSNPWMSSHTYHESPVPHTPSHRDYSRAPDIMYFTPSHRRHPYPYSYNPDLSHATLPPDSPDASSPEKPPFPRRKSLVRRSQSRGRQVSFYLEDDIESDEIEVHSSPSKRRTKGRVGRSQHTSSPKPNSSKAPKGKGRARTPYSSSKEHDSDSEDSASARRPKIMYARGRTPGPSFSSPPSKRNTYTSSEKRSNSQPIHREH